MCKAACRNPQNALVNIKRWQRKRFSHFSALGVVSCKRLNTGISVQPVHSKQPGIYKRGRLPWTSSPGVSVSLSLNCIINIPSTWLWVFSNACTCTCFPDLLKTTKSSQYHHMLSGDWRPWCTCMYLFFCFCKKYRSKMASSWWMLLIMFVWSNSLFL